jgi:hypothetical protein
MLDAAQLTRLGPVAQALAARNEAAVSVSA